MGVRNAAAAGRYTVQASVSGSTKNADIDARTTVPPLEFSFP